VHTRRKHIPTYRLHKKSGQAIVALSDGQGGRRDVLLRPYDNPASRKECIRLAGTYLSEARKVPRQ
jgi:hypothetical protein